MRAAEQRERRKLLEAWLALRCPLVCAGTRFYSASLATSDDNLKRSASDFPFELRWKSSNGNGANHLELASCPPSLSLVRIGHRVK